jgi:hypothetical protein
MSVANAVTNADTRVTSALKARRAWDCGLRLASLCFTMLAATVGSAQSAPPSPGSPVCSDGGAPVVDTSTVTVVIAPATAWNRRRYTDEDKQRILFYADAMRQRFVAPAGLGNVPTLVESLLPGWGGDFGRHSAVGGKLVLVVKPNGRLRESFWQVVPLSAPFATAVRGAAQAADSSGDFDGIPGTGTGRVDDTLVVQVLSLRTEPSATHLPLMRAQLMSYVPDALATVTKKGELIYPINASDNSVENEGEMQVIVGSDGKAVMRSSQITRIDWRDFINTMLRAIEKSEYSPARSGACAVPSVRIERFKFGIIR